MELQVLPGGDECELGTMNGKQTLASCAKLIEWKEPEAGSMRATE